MSELNQYAISQILGSTIAPIRSPLFGGFSLLAVSADAIRAKASLSRGPAAFSVDDDKRIVAAFEGVREGLGTDVILWNKAVAQAFHEESYQLGVTLPPAAASRRLIRIRKDPRFFKERGVVIQPATVSSPHESVVPQFAHAIEFALVRLKYRHGASIDDVLIDPLLADEFENLAAAMAPGLSSIDLRLGALYIRKTRHFTKADKPKLQSLNPLEIEDQWSSPVPVRHADEVEAESTPGLIELREASRVLYVSRNQSLQPTLEQLATGRAIELMADHFWHPNLDDITVRLIGRDRINGETAHNWELRLISFSKPVFNWPLAA